MGRCTHLRSWGVRRGLKVCPEPRQPGAQRLWLPALTRRGGRRTCVYGARQDYRTGRQKADGHGPPSDTPPAPHLASGPRGRSDRHILAGGESHRCDRTDSTGTGTCPAANVSTQQLPTMAEMSSLLRSAHKGIPRRKRWKARPGSDEGFAGATRLPRRVAAAASRSAGRASSRPGCVQSGSATVSAQTRV